MMDKEEIRRIENYVLSAKNKAVKKINIEKREITYADEIIKNRIIHELTGNEELVRAIILTKLANDYGYKLNKIEIERTYKIGRPKTITPRIDVIVYDERNNPFLFIELKAPEEYEHNQDEVIEKQLFNLAALEIAGGREIRHLALVSCDLNNDSLDTKALVIDYNKYKSFEGWKEERNCSDELPAEYGEAIKQPYIKGSNKDLQTGYSSDLINTIRANLHNVLWGGGGTDDNEVFSSLVNIILAKIQDESEKNEGARYDFQNLHYKRDGKGYPEDNKDLFNRINELYRRALKERLYITDIDIIEKSYVINQDKFSIGKLKYAVSVFEKYSLVDGKNSTNGKDILGEFFEGIIRDGFKQSKGQFFTHANIVRFILWGLQLDRLAIQKINNEKTLPYVIDPSAGSGTFLIEYMRFITQNIKYRFRNCIDKNRDVEDRFAEWFYPDHRENKWAKNFIYGIEHNFNLGAATKVNMILHGDGSTNIFVKDGLLHFKSYNNRKDAGNILYKSSTDTEYCNLPTNSRFDVVVSNPPFSVELDQDTKKSLGDSFLFSKKSENLFIERYYQLLKENGRMGIVLPESVFDTAENKYIRLFIYKYFKIKAIVSLSQVAFKPYTPTKTTILFAQKKTKTELKHWQNCWNDAAREYQNLKTRVENLIKVYKNDEDRNSFPSIRGLDKSEEINILKKFLQPYDIDIAQHSEPKNLVECFGEEIATLLKVDQDTAQVFGFVNLWWVFSSVSKLMDYKITICHAENIGYKRKKRGEDKMPNDLFKLDAEGRVVVGPDDNSTILSSLRKITWD